MDAFKTVDVIREEGNSNEKVIKHRGKILLIKLLELHIIRLAVFSVFISGSDRA